jgi:hypothetical protein
VNVRKIEGNGVIEGEGRYKERRVNRREQEVDNERKEKRRTVNMFSVPVQLP